MTKKITLTTDQIKDVEDEYRRLLDILWMRPHPNACHYWEWQGNVNGFIKAIRALKISDQIGIDRINMEYIDKRRN